MIQNLKQKAWDWFAKKTGLVNNTAWNRYHWRKYLRKERQNSPKGVVGYDWGDPEAANDYLGNYKRVCSLLQESLVPAMHVVEIGSYGGKWTQYMEKAGQVTCVDLFEDSFDFLKERIGPKINLRFYKTRGDELAGIATESVDLVFSMDTFVRIPTDSIQKYFFEMFRILKKDGKVLVHLPCNDIPFCRRKAFTNISTAWIRRGVEKAGFRQYLLEEGWLKHGVLLSATK